MEPNAQEPVRCRWCLDTVRLPIRHGKPVNPGEMYICDPCLGYKPMWSWFDKFRRSRNIADKQYHGEYAPHDS